MTSGFFFCVCVSFFKRHSFFVVLNRSEVSNGSSSMQESAVGGSMLSLTNKTSALSLTSDPGASGSEIQKNGVAHSCS